MTDKLGELLTNNRLWSERHRREDPDYFSRLTAIQRPDYLWIGCADSRVPAERITNALPGELFVHRSVANLVRPDDTNIMSALQYAIDVLRGLSLIGRRAAGCSCSPSGSR